MYKLLLVISIRCLLSAPLFYFLFFSLKQILVNFGHRLENLVHAIEDVQAGAVEDVSVLGLRILAFNERVTAGDVDLGVVCSKRSRGLGRLAKFPQVVEIRLAALAGTINHQSICLGSCSTIFLLFLDDAQLYSRPWSHLLLRRLGISCLVIVYLINALSSLVLDFGPLDEVLANPGLLEDHSQEVLRFDVNVFATLILTLSDMAWPLLDLVIHNVGQLLAEQQALLQILCRLHVQEIVDPQINEILVGDHEQTLSVL